MIRAFALAALCAAPALADDSPGGVSIVAESARDTYYVGEPFRVTLRLRYDAEWFKAHAIEMFRRPLDVPVQIGAPWMRGVTGTFDVVADPAAPAGATRTLALDDAVETASVADAETLVVTHRFVARRAGRVDLPAPTVRFEFAERFDDDLVHGRVPLDRRPAVVLGSPLPLTIVDLPSDGRPATFSGGIGRFAMTASADRTSAAVGEHLTLRLSITGDGNLDALAPPRLDAFPGFHVFGVLDDRGAATRTVTYELAPLSAVSEIPPIPLEYFDPMPPAQYRTARSATIPLRVTGAAGEAAPRAAPPPPSFPTPPDRSGTVLIAIVLFCAVVAVLAARRRRAAQRVVVDPAADRARAAAAAFRAALASSPSTATDALTAYLAACLDCAPGAVVSANLAERLVAAGVPMSLASRTSALVERLIATRYGGGADPAAVEEARAVVDELERAFEARAPD